MTRTIELDSELDARLQSEASRCGKAAEELAAELIDRSLPRLEAAGEQSDMDYVFELAERIRNSIPPEALERVPPDLAKNLDHYLYGHPKREA